MMTATDNAAHGANEIHITRVYEAPVALVWDAWTDLAQVTQWWGPRGFTITTHHKDLRVGGTWQYTMHGPDGKDWPNFTRYHEVAPRAKLVYEQQTSHHEIFVINRSFDAPIESMYDLWTKPEHFAKWLPPTGFTMAFRRADIRSGGDAFYAMTNGQFTMYGRVEYLKVQPPGHIEYTQCFTDEHENISRHPGAPVWPERMHTTVTLTAEGPTATRVTVRWAVFGEATPAEVAAFTDARAGMTMGWTGSFDKLEALLMEAAATH